MRRLLLLFLFATSCTAQSQTINVPIVNPSFEDHPVPLPFNQMIGGTVCGRVGWNGIPGWQNSATVFEPYVGPNPTWPCYNTQPPDGSAVGIVSNATMFQDLGITASSLQPLSDGQDGDGLYVMKFFVANFFNAYPGYYEGKVLIGPPLKNGQAVDQWLGTLHELCSADGWGERHWNEITVVCPSPDYVVYDNWPAPTNPTASSNPEDHLIISLSASGWTLMFDKVSLTFTPQS